jgi:hypothetical protein
MSMQKADLLPRTSTSTAHVSVISNLLAGAGGNGREEHIEGRAAKAVPHLDWPDDLFDDPTDV